MSNYKILRWDARTDDCSWDSLTPRPMIYFEPNTDFVEFVERNNGFVRVTLSNTGSTAYDNKTFWGIVEKSANMPDGRLNFYDATQLWVIVLHTMWNSYPPNLGQFNLNKGVVDADPRLVQNLKVMGQRPVMAKPKLLKKLTPKLSDDNTNNNKGLSTGGIIAVSLGLVFLLIFFMAFIQFIRK